MYVRQNMELLLALWLSLREAASGEIRQEIRVSHCWTSSIRLLTPPFAGEHVAEFISGQSICAVSKEV
jgi:hypothetical protein